MSTPSQNQDFLEKFFGSGGNFSTLALKHLDNETTMDEIVEYVLASTFNRQHDMSAERLTNPLLIGCSYLLQIATKSARTSTDAVQLENGRIGKVQLDKDIQGIITRLENQRITDGPLSGIPFITEMYHDNKDVVNMLESHGAVHLGTEDVGRDMYRSADQEIGAHGAVQRGFAGFAILSASGTSAREKSIVAKLAMARNVREGITVVARSFNDIQSICCALGCEVVGRTPVSFSPSPSDISILLQLLFVDTRMNIRLLECAKRLLLKGLRVKVFANRTIIDADKCSEESLSVVRNTGSFPSEDDKCFSNEWTFVCSPAVEFMPSGQKQVSIPLDGSMIVVTQMRDSDGNLFDLAKYFLRNLQSMIKAETKIARRGTAGRAKRAEQAVEAQEQIPKKSLNKLRESPILPDFLVKQMSEPLEVSRPKHLEPLPPLIFEPRYRELQKSEDHSEAGPSTKSIVAEGDDAKSKKSPKSPASKRVNRDPL